MVGESIYKHTPFALRNRGLTQFYRFLVELFVAQIASLGEHSDLSEKGLKISVFFMAFEFTFS